MSIHVLFITHCYNKYVPAVYNNGTHYVINKKLMLEILKKISDREQILQISDEYIGCSATIGSLYELRNQRNSSNTVSMDKDVFLDNKNIAVEQEVKNIKLQKCQSHSIFSLFFGHIA